jgi:hypothetical protein
VLQLEMALERPMKPAARRRVERELRNIMRQNGDHCSLCRARLQHNSPTYGGILKGGASALTGVCCRTRIEIVVLEGLYLDRGADDLVSQLAVNEVAKPNWNATGGAQSAVETIKRIFDERQADGRAVARRAGLPEGSARLFTGEAAWKADDAAWFAANVDRSHRLRPLHREEAAASGFPTGLKMPARHELQVLVRQVEPGKRARLPFGRNLDVPIPDHEAVLHALFDIVGENGRNGSVISAEMVGAAIAKYLGKRGLPS